jgi:quercetin dioxygenase-like cupin family protein
MGGVYSTQQKKFSGYSFSQVCNEGREDYDEDALVYSQPELKGLHNLYVASDYGLVHLPKRLTVRDFCSYGISFSYFELQESNLLTVAIVLFAMSAIPNHQFNRWILFVRLALVALGLVVILRASNPKQTIAFNDLLTSTPRSFSKATHVSTLVKDGQFTPPTGLAKSLVPGTKSIANKSDISEEYLEIVPNAVLPLHTHDKEVYAVMVSGDLEYTVGGQWIPWSKGAIVYVNKHVAHSVRAGPTGGTLMTFTDDTVSPLISMNVRTLTQF